MELQAGAQAPDFTAKDQNGQSVSLHDFTGKKVVLYFYPKDDTPGCTAQACNLRDNFSVLKAKGIEVLGVSVNSEKSHKKFEEKYTLPFTLLVDDAHALADAYGVWGEKKFMGRTYMGTHRVTFLIDESGKIAHIISKVDTKAHTQQILEIWGLA
jgi:peroxiredoxin Q/BCP